MGKKLWDIEPFNIIEESKISFGKLIGEGYVRHEELQLRTKDGRSIHTEFISNVYKIDSRMVIHCHFRDFTEQKLEREELHRRTEELDTFFNIITDLLCIAGTDGYFKRLNPAWEVKLGLSREETLSRPFFDFIHPDDIRKTREAVAILSEQQEVAHFINRYRRKDGVYCWLEWRATPAGDVIYAAARDITERMLIEEKSRMLASIVESTDDAIIGLTPDGIVTGWNRGAEIIYGYSVSEMIGKPISTIVPHGQEDDARHFLERVRRGEDLEHSETLRRRKDGKIIHASITVTPIRNDMGDMAGAVAIERDITELKQTELSLREAVKRYHTLFEVANDAIFIVDRDRFFDCNQMALKMFGCRTKDDIISHTPLEFSPPQQPGGVDSKEIISGYISAAYAGTPQGFYWRYLRKDKTYFDSEVSLNRIELGDQFYIQVMVRDITEQKLAEQEIRENEERYRITLESIPDAVSIQAIRGGRYLYVNEAFPRITGYSRDEVIGRTPADLKLPAVPGEQDPFIRCIVDVTGCERLELKYRMKDGSILDMLTSFTPVHYKGEDCAVLVMKDITPLKEYEEEKKRLETQVAQSQKIEALGTLAGGIAHDLNNVLTAIIGYSELAVMNASSPEKVKKYVNDAIKSGRRAKDLVSQILAFSRRAERKYSPITLYYAVQDSLDMLRSMIPSSIEIRHSLVARGKVMADPAQMNQMMMNLAINAAHAMGKDGGVLDVSLKKENLDETAAQNVGLPKGSYLKLTVSDTGSGMTPSVMARMYEPYFTTNKKGGSTGMGLSIVHGIVKRHMGAITCRSDIGKGTVFEIYLPEVVAPAGGAKAYNGEKALQAGNERILFVDDEPDITALAKAMLEDLGCRVTAKTSSMEALELFKKDPDKFDLVITDMTMPGMTGDRLAQKILEVKADMPVIMCTGYSEYITEKRAKSIGIREYMMKPLEMEKLVRIIRKVLGEHQAIN